ncbi:MAG: capsular biosynthesis protein [Prevotellaceae bacterium]|jgi:tyrosine-protein phosphatase YwqE|nr:capsular biosynthesis protein [Prevotellaceae bacterium]
MFFRKKYSIAETGLLQGMSDIHSHLLYGVDDGMQTEEETFAALEYLEEQGVQRIYLTPHVMENFPENSSKSLKRHFDNLINGYAGNIDLRLAAEYMLDSSFESHLENYENKPLAIADDCLLVETSYLNPPLNFHQTIQKIKKKGYRIILAHPERYLYMDKNDYRKLKADGFLFFQLNLLSPTGYYGRQVQENAEYLLKNDFYTFTGTDIHSLESHRQAFNIKSLTAKLTDRINVLIENNRQLLFN